LVALAALSHFIGVQRQKAWIKRTVGRVNHPEWTEDLVFKAVGSFWMEGKEVRSGGWMLCAERGTPLLVLRWDRYGTESLLMNSGGHFRG
jgi:hypothetical protein